MANVSVLNSDSGLTSKTLSLLESDQTFTGLKTFSRGAAAPFACAAGSLLVTNLDADKLDGQEGTYYTNATNLASGTVAAARLTASLAHIVEGRLTLTTALPVTVADVTAAVTIYYTPYIGNCIALYDGSVSWTLRNFSELSLAVGTITSGKNYDIFIYDNAGTAALEMSAAWASDTARTDALTRQDGVLVKSGATTRRYIGTFRTTSTTTTEDSKLKRFLWNAYNRRPVQMLAIEGTDSWTYTTATWRQANGSAANQVEIVTGQAEDAIQLTVAVQASNSNAVQIAVGIGEDSTTVPSANFLRVGTIPTSTYTPVISMGSAYPSIGYHKYCWLEFSTASGTGTWYGDNGSTTVQSGMTGTWWR